MAFRFYPFTSDRIASNELQYALESRGNHWYPHEVPKTVQHARTWRAIICLQTRGTDPSQAAEIWQLLIMEGLDVEFATCDGHACDSLDPIALDSSLKSRISALFRGVHRHISSDAREIYGRMITTTEYLRPRNWSDADFSLGDFDIVILPGGSGPGMRALIENTQLHSKLAELHNRLFSYSHFKQLQREADEIRENVNHKRLMRGFTAGSDKRTDSGRMTDSSNESFKVSSQEHATERPRSDSLAVSEASDSLNEKQFSSNLIKDKLRPVILAVIGQAVATLAYAQPSPQWSMLDKFTFTATPRWMEKGVSRADDAIFDLYDRVLPNNKNIEDMLNDSLQSKDNFIAGPESFVPFVHTDRSFAVISARCNLDIDLFTKSLIRVVNRVRHVDDTIAYWSKLDTE